VEENIEKKETKVKLNAREEVDNVISKTILEFQGTIENFELSKVTALIAKDEKRTVNLLFYGNDFIAINRVNFRNGYEYNSKKDSEVISENLNYRIKKIPNVAKTRKVLNIDNIETRIYDIREYIVLLNKEEIKLLKVHGQEDISELTYAEYKINTAKLKEEIEEYEYKLIEENSFKNKVKKMAQTAKSIALIIKNKLLKTNQVKMLSDGKDSVFDK